MNQLQHNHIDVEHLASTLREKLLQKSPWGTACCIFRVPTTLSWHNQIAYKPKSFSIGPFHHHHENLQAMEKIKLWYLDSLLARAPTPHTTLECFFRAIKDNLEQCLQCYAENILNSSFSTDKFIEMMVLDGCFIIELFRKTAGKVKPLDDDPIFKSSWMRKNLLTDLLLLENQLPWFVLECLFDLSNADLDPINGNPLSLADLALKFFSFNTLRKIWEDELKPNPRFQNKHLLDFQRNNLLSSFAVKEADRLQDWYRIPCVTELLQAGVHFKRGDETKIMNIEFSNGVMTIPPIIILDNAGSFFRNLIAYEQCDRSFKDKITSYALLWDNLINSSKDLDFLREQGIITCFLSTDDLSDFFNKLYNDADIVYYAYAKLSRDILVHCQKRWPRWRVLLLRDYFGTPWSITSFTVAIILLALTFIQTLYSINPL